MENISPDVAWAYEIFTQNRFMYHIGVRMTELSRGRCVMFLPFGEHLLQSARIVQGGALAAVLDEAAAYAVLTLCDSSLKNLATIEYKVNFLSSSTEHDFTAVAQVARKGGRVALLEGQGHWSDGREAIRGLFTFLITTEDDQNS
ncbi:MAG: PaaI family thioesterase [Proteobacteria bacterium]|nr:PaaI family thioesterase [Pseudomonadota bacterium]MBU1742194.1 PaaI family thioesterase [Pseudomonadota bacterium]